MTVLKNIRRSTRGAIDLASIMVGSIIIGIIGGIIAVTIFVVIPWAQDNAAKNQLDSIHTAENAHRGLAEEQAGTPVYLNSADLASKKLLPEGPQYCVTVSPDKTNYVGYSKSATGKIFSSSTANNRPVVVQSAPCLSDSPVAQPSQDSVSTFTINCPAGVTEAQLPLNGFTGTSTWSDGIITTTANTVAPLRTVTPEQSYTVTVEGTFYTLSTSKVPDASKSCIRSMDSWGAKTGTTSAAYGFYEATNLTAVPKNLPSTVTDISSMFGKTAAFNQSLNTWDTANVTNMQNTFFSATAFNSPLDKWDTSNVKTTLGMFYNATAFNQPLNSWKMDKVQDASSMFRGAKLFNQPLNSWTMPEVKTTGLMFQDASAFNGNISSWNTPLNTDTHNMFFNAKAFNQPLNSWDMGSVENASLMFSTATAFNQPLNNWKMGSVTDMRNMFTNATSFNQNIGSWDVSKVKDFRNMFSGATVFNGAISSWKTTSSEDMRNMFQKAKSFNQDLSGWDVAKTTMFANFADESALTPEHIPLAFR